MNGKLPISKDTFSDPEDEKHFRGMLYDLLIYGAECNEKLDARIRKLERRKWIDKGLTAITGFAGGFIAYFSTKLPGIFGR